MPATTPVLSQDGVSSEPFKPATSTPNSVIAPSAPSSWIPVNDGSLLAAPQPRKIPAPANCTSATPAATAASTTSVCNSARSAVPDLSRTALAGAMNANSANFPHVTRCLCQL
jgi:hypothetical protein